MLVVADLMVRLLEVEVSVVEKRVRCLVQLLMVLTTQNKDYKMVYKVVVVI